MRRKMACFMACFTLMQSSVHAALSENNVEIKREVLIPFCIETNIQSGEEKIDISRFNGAKVKEINVDNGEVVANIENGFLTLRYGGGECNVGLNQRKIDVLEIENAKYDEEMKCVVAKPEKQVIGIKGVYGAFESAEISENGDILLKVKENAPFENGFDKDKTSFSEIEVDVETGNRKRNITTDFVKLPYVIADNSIAVTKDTSGLARVEIKDNAVRVHFSDGTPIRNTFYQSGGHTYYWIDRFQDGSFKKYNPNSVYTTDRKIINGEGAYLSKNDKKEIGMNFSDDRWVDFCGVEIDGKKYTYSFDKKKGLPEKSMNEAFIDNEITINDGEFNTEKYTVNFSKAGVSYIPQGKLLSMGKLVPDTEGWGEEVRNKPWESTERFLNSITGNFETYVKHYKFFYGPAKKIVFGGYYTYPYSCKVRYKHYLPTKLYSGGVCYEYLSEKADSEYLYYGYVRLEYDDMVANMPPTAPYHIVFDNGSKLLSWFPGTDDYTSQDKLRYEIEIEKDGVWKPLATSLPGKTSFNYGESFEDIRIRTLDDGELVSEWGKLEESVIELSGSVDPYLILQGEKFNLFADTKSLYDIKSVKARNNSLNLDVPLISEEKKISEFYEISFDVKKKGGSKDKKIESAYFAENKDGVVKINEFFPIFEQSHGSFEVFFPVGVPFEVNGSIVIPGKYTEKTGVFFENANTNVTECFVEVICKDKNKNSTKLKINSFRYDNSGEAKYYTIDLDANKRGEVISVIWNTDVYGVTEFCFFCGEQEVFKFSRRYEEIKNVFSEFKSYVGDSIGIYRILFSDTDISKEERKRYLSLLKNEDDGILANNVQSVFGNMILNKVERFSLKDIFTSENSTAGLYEILLIAEDSMGNRQTTRVILQIEQREYEKELIKEDDENQDTSVVEGKSPVLGRVFYDKNRRYMEELKKPKNNSNSEGFLCAGETLAMNVTLKNTDFLVVDLIGDESVKTFDSLTERFLCKDGNNEAEVLETMYQFPKVLYPIFTDTEESTSTFQFTYVVPYRTKQSLHSWSTLKRSSLEEINTNRLFERICTPYKIVIYPNGLTGAEKKWEFDVFERWDTVLNRDVSRYLKNANARKSVWLGSD